MADQLAAADVGNSELGATAPVGVLKGSRSNVCQRAHPSAFFLFGGPSTGPETAGIVVPAYPGTMYYRPPSSAQLYQQRAQEARERFPEIPLGLLGTSRSTLALGPGDFPLPLSPLPAPKAPQRTPVYDGSPPNAPHIHYILREGPVSAKWEEQRELGRLAGLSAAQRPALGTS